MVRESLMCNPDLTPDVWKWSDRVHSSAVRFDTIHTCRKWEPIQEWANAHTAHVEFNQGIHLVDDLHFPDDKYAQP